MITQRELEDEISKRMEEIKELYKFQKLNLGGKVEEENLRDCVEFYAKEFELRGLIDFYHSKYGDSNQHMNTLSEISRDHVSIYRDQILKSMMK
tara:strand:+ start:642 stop:923 length:282 start_codon:yes stop_codon:yes gene_type:complete